MFTLKEAIEAQQKGGYCYEKFGKWLFGEFLNKPNKNNPEKDTPYERDTLRAIIDYINTSYGGNRAKLEKYIDSLFLCKQKYPDVLQPQKNKSLFRAITIEKDSDVGNELYQQIYNAVIKDSFTHEEHKKDSRGEKSIKYFLTKKVNYISLNNLESWSTDQYSTFNLFSGKKGYSPIREMRSLQKTDNEEDILKILRNHLNTLFSTRVVFEYTMPNNNEIIFDSDFLNKIGKEYYNHRSLESEVIRVVKRGTKTPMRCWISEDSYYIILFREYFHKKFDETKLINLYNVIMDTA